MKVRTAHISLQFSDTDRQTTSDVEKLFKRGEDRGWAWLTGTEAGPGAGNTGEELIRVARDYGFRPWVPSQTERGIKRFTDCWVAVNKDFVDGGWRQGYRHVLSGSDHYRDSIKMPPGKRWGPKGVVHVGFDNDKLGRLNVGVAHYLTDARHPGSPYWKLNKLLAEAIGDWAREAGHGSDLAFYAGDQNMADDKNSQPQGDTFFGQPLTSAWDELKKWEGTGHGNIDVIASYNRDRRVKALKVKALSDKEFHLHTDHFLVEATYKIKPIRRSKRR